VPLTNPRHPVGGINGPQLRPPVTQLLDEPMQFRQPFLREVPMFHERRGLRGPSLAARDGPTPGGPVPFFTRTGARHWLGHPGTRPGERDGTGPVSAPGSLAATRSVGVVAGQSLGAHTSGVSLWAFRGCPMRCWAAHTEAALEGARSCAPEAHDG